MSTSTMPWRKNSFELESPVQNKTERATIRYYFRLESESSPGSTDDTESVYSLQDKETDFVKDTSDTASDTSEYQVDVDIEYEIESVSESEDKDMIIFDSSGESEDMIYAAAMVADSSLETFITDAEDSDTSRQDDSNVGRTDFWICIQCKSQNDHPQYRFCDKCFQGRKAIFPPRPRRRKKAAKKPEKPPSPVKLDLLRSCLNGMSSQDSGISSSQEFGSLCLDQIVVPSTSAAEEEEAAKSRKRQVSESSLSDEYEAKRPPKRARTTDKDEPKREEKRARTTDKDEEKRTAEETPSAPEKGPLPELKEDCIMCNVNPKNSVFLHGRIAHMCCCYKCAMRTWKSTKRCPICQRKVSNVVRVFTM